MEISTQTREMDPMRSPTEAIEFFKDLYRHQLRLKFKKPQDEYPDCTSPGLDPFSFFMDEFTQMTDSGAQMLSRQFSGTPEEIKIQVAAYLSDPANRDLENLVTGIQSGNPAPSLLPHFNDQPEFEKIITAFLSFSETDKRSFLNQLRAVDFSHIEVLPQKTLAEKIIGVMDAAKSWVKKAKV